ncbi:MAG: uroporphyrinogen-III C-methyltransferase [Gemmatimonadetes bacterium]|nr:uroporphyrinogen-III C-methyltransferase [Gemmatimonadota bacterium]MYB60207.1 uroporphyrinogen-III C-methyltransferase [Gemmatimonadota bacterium]
MNAEFPDKTESPGGSASESSSGGSASAATPGMVYLVGAGPGDPGLITVKGLSCVRRADVVVADFLADDRLVAEAPGHAERIRVPWRPGRQAEINDLLVRHSRAGKTVVRLKGGDPFVFGRGGEEGLHLQRSGIPFEVVPGITAAVAVPAYAGIPVTHREITSSMTVVTGHVSQDRDRTDLDWEALAKRIGTLIFYMGARNLPFIAERLIEHGRPKDTPVALIQWGTTAEQRTLVGTLDDIVSRARSASFTPPVLIVVGEVVALRPQLDWFESKPLFGVRVLVTRARDQAGELSEALVRHGAEPVEAPLIRIEAPDDWRAVDAALADLSGFDHVVFTSRNAVEAFFSRLNHKGLDARSLGGVRVAAVGRATAGALRSRGIEADDQPEVFRAEKLVEALAGDRDLHDARILFPAADIAGPAVEEGLAAAGAYVTRVTVYRTVLEEGLPDDIASMLEDGKIHLAVFASSSTVSAFAKAAGPDGPQRWTRGVRIACIGPSTAETAAEAGLSVDVVPVQATVPALVDAIVRDRLAAGERLE